MKNPIYILFLNLLKESLSYFKNIKFLVNNKLTYNKKN